MNYSPFASSPSVYSSYPSSFLHPASRDNSHPFGQAVEGTAMDMLCLLSNERRNVTVGLSAGPSQPSIHTCGISSVYKTAGRQLCSPFLSLPLPFSSSFYLSFTLSISLTRSASLPYCLCASLPVYFWSQTSRDPGLLWQYTSPCLPLTQHYWLNIDIPNEGWRKALP